MCPLEILSSLVPTNFKTIPSGLQKKFSLEKQMSTTCVKVEPNSKNLSKHLMGNLVQIAKFPPTDTQYKVALPITQLLKEHTNCSNKKATKKQQNSGAYGSRQFQGTYPEES